MMENESEIRQELEQLAPGLNKLDKNDRFTIPENYFYQLPGLINEKIKKKENFLPWYELHHKPILAKVSLAFMVLIITGTTIYFAGFYKKPIETKITTESYIIENVDEATLEDFITENTQRKMKIEDQSESSLENIDESLIIEEL
jgi:hypothetical protein